MATIHIIGNSVDDHECAAFIAGEAYALANQAIGGLLAHFKSAAEIPPSLKISDNEPGGWHGSEVEINEAVKRGDWLTLLRVCPAYIVRVNRFCDTWLARIQQAPATEATV